MPFFERRHMVCAYYFKAGGGRGGNLSGGSSPLKAQITAGLFVIEICQIHQAAENQVTGQCRVSDCEANFTRAAGRRFQLRFDSVPAHRIDFVQNQVR